MNYGDLRGWLKKVEEMGELKYIRGAHWDLEIGAITELAYHKEGKRPCLLFDEIPGYPKGFRVVSNTLNSLRRLGMTLRLKEEETKDTMTFIDSWRKKYRDIKPIPYKLVKDGPIFENVLSGDKIDAFIFPAPKWHELDGGREIGTGSFDITRHPDEGWVNLGCYRVEILDEKNLGFFISPGKHGRIHRDIHFSRGEACKVAVSISQDPLLFLVSGFEFPFGVSEYDITGGIKGEPVEVVEAPYTKLPIPADAEIVIEGESLPTEQRKEGPFGEWTGYYGSGARAEPVIRIKNILYRNDPIILGAPPGRPPTDLSFTRSIMRSGMVWDTLEKAGIPDVRGVYMPEYGGGRMFMVVSIKQRYPGHSRQAALVASQCQAGAYLGRYVVVVDDDIDPSDQDAVWWAISSRAEPSEDIEIIRKTWSGPLDPRIPPGQKGYNSRAIIDACRPYDWIDKFPAVSEMSRELKEKTKEKWGKALED